MTAPAFERLAENRAWSRKRHFPCPRWMRSYPMRKNVVVERSAADRARLEAMMA
jgi:hypothetical protein